MQGFLAKSKGWPGFILPVTLVTVGVAHTTDQDTLAFIPGPLPEVPLTLLTGASP